ncbi:Protein kinase domain-containing protein [Mycena kentingensis (nom. inval.)]|nr:Protein kinase domain-containing protein [Mycena kentingensis (nom. inval.)]
MSDTLIFNLPVHPDCNAHLEEALDAANFRGELTPLEFLDTVLPKPANETETLLRLTEIGNKALDLGEDFKDSVCKAFIETANTLLNSPHMQVFGIPCDLFPSPDHVTPSAESPATLFCHPVYSIGVVVGDCDLIQQAVSPAGKIATSDNAKQAFAHLVNSARHTFLYLWRCRIYLIVVFGVDQARIVCFDRSGFAATEAFNWQSDIAHLAHFFLRLISRAARSARRNEVDDTLWAAPERTTRNLWDAIRHHPFYAGHQQLQSEREFKANCLVLFAAQRNSEGQQELVKCLTVGPSLFTSSDVFGRATQVFRVVVETDLDAYIAAPRHAKPTLTFYALKDVWLSERNRPETNFYDFLEHHCKNANPPIDMDAEGMARCRGVLDLSSPATGGGVLWQVQRHRTTFGGESGQRRHVRMLLTPVGRKLSTFECTKDLVATLGNTVNHLLIAYEAGILHRDVSAGNIMLVEEHSGRPGFLLDYDYAEFTADGAARFNSLPEFADRRQVDLEELERSLNRYSGTLQFSAVEMLQQSTNESYNGPLTSFRHNIHHDLKSLYWVLVWLVLHHMKDACLPLGSLPEFFTAPPAEKIEWFYHDSAVPLKDRSSPLGGLLSQLRDIVGRQVVEGVPIKSTGFLAVFCEAFQAEEERKADITMQQRANKRRVGDEDEKENSQRAKKTKM